MQWLRTYLSFWGKKLVSLSPVGYEQGSTFAVVAAGNHIMTMTVTVLAGNQLCGSRENVLDDISKLPNQLALESTLLLDFLIYEINALGVQASSKLGFHLSWLGDILFDTEFGT